MMAFMTSCGGDKDNAGNANMISGGSSKTWKANKETTASGDRDKLLATAYQLRQTVYELFDITKVGPAYEELFHKQSS